MWAWGFTYHISNSVCMTLKYSHNSLHIDINNVNFEIFKRNGQQRTAKREKVVSETCALCCTN